MNRANRVLAALAVGMISAACAGTPGCSAPPKVTPGCERPARSVTVPYRALRGVPANDLSLDIHAPANACRAPVVMWVHGGAYQTGDKANGIGPKRALFNSRGWIFVSVNYRLTRPGQASSAKFPDHYEDVAASVAWVRSRIGTYGGDPGKLALLGHSAGADIVSNVAANPRYLSRFGQSPGALRCVGPLDTEGFDKTAVSTDAAPYRQWETALGNNPNFARETSATLIIAEARRRHADTIGVVRGSSRRQRIERGYLSAVASSGARAVTIPAGSLSHSEVSSSIGRPGDRVMTPPLVDFLRRCFA